MNPSSRSSPRPRAPIDFRARGVQLRLMLLVALILGGASLAEAYFSGRFPFARAAASGESPRLLETRLPAEPPVAESELTHLHLPAPVQPWTEPPSRASQNQASADQTSVQADFWKHLFDSLSLKQRDQLQAVLRATLHHTPPPLSTSERAELKIRLDEHVVAYQAKSQTELSDSKLLTEERRQVFRAALEAMAKLWAEEYLPALDAALDQDEITAEHRKTLERLNQTWSDLALSQVRDDDISPTTDFLAWFGLFELLRRDPQAAAAASPAPYADLFDRSSQMRGQPVLISGEIRAATHEKALKNLYGIDGYYVYWVRPGNYADAPVKIFALEPPIDPQTGKAVDLASLVGRQCTSKTLYFKRMAYRAQDNLRTVPTLLAAKLELLPIDDSAAKMNNSFGFSVLLALAGVLGGLFLVFYLFSDRKLPRNLPKEVDLSLGERK